MGRVGGKAEENDIIGDRNIDHFKLDMTRLRVKEKDERKRRIRIGMGSCGRKKRFLEPIQANFVISPSVFRRRNPSKYNENQDTGENIRRTRFPLPTSGHPHGPPRTSQHTY